MPERNTNVHRVAGDQRERDVSFPPNPSNKVFSNSLSCESHLPKEKNGAILLLKSLQAASVACDREGRMSALQSCRGGTINRRANGFPHEQITGEIRGEHSDVNGVIHNQSVGHRGCKEKFYSFHYY